MNSFWQKTWKDTMRNIMNEQRIIAHIASWVSCPGNETLRNLVSRVSAQTRRACHEIMISSNMRTQADRDIFTQMLKSAQAMKDMGIHVGISSSDACIATQIQIAREYWVKSFYLWLDDPSNYILRCMIAHEAITWDEKIVLDLHSDSSVVQWDFLWVCLRTSKRVVWMCDSSGTARVLQSILKAAAFHPQCQILACQKTYNAIPESQKEYVTGIIVEK